MGNIESRESTISGDFGDGAHELFSIMDESTSFPGSLDITSEEQSNFENKQAQITAMDSPWFQKARSAFSYSTGLSSSSESISLNQPKVSPKPGRNYMNRMDHVSIEKKASIGKSRRNVIRGVHNVSSKKAFILSPPNSTTIGGGDTTHQLSKLDQSSSFHQSESDPIQRYVTVVSGYAYSHDYLLCPYRISFSFFSIQRLQ